MEYVFDAEFDGFNPTKIHVLSVDTEEGIKSTGDYEKISEFISGGFWLVGHNIIHYDLPHIERLTSSKSRGTIVDTLFLSYALFPDRRRHSLESWGEELGYDKVQIEDWHTLSYEDYRERCERDVEINSLLWKKVLRPLLVELYGSVEKALPFIEYLAFKAWSTRIAEENRVELDVPLVKKNISILEEIQREKEGNLRFHMPKVPVYSKMKYPKNPKKKDGTDTVVMERFSSICKEQGLDPEKTEEVLILKGYEEPNPTSVPQIKDWLFSLGWKPNDFKTNKKKEDVPQISTTDPGRKGELSTSVIEMFSEYPFLEDLEGLFTIQHRLGILRGFLNDEEDGYLKARVAGLTNTLRFKHSELVNLPSVDSPYGKYIRPCLTAGDGEVLVGSDMSSLEDRTKQHYMYFYDPEYVNEMNVPGFDPHLDIAVQSGALSEKDVEDYKSGERVKEIKPIRHNAKTTNYSCTYGAFPNRIAKDSGMPLSEAQVLWDAYWKRNWSIKSIEADTEVVEVNGRTYLYNPVSGFYYFLKFTKDKFSTLNQGTGAFCFDTWVYFILKEDKEIIAQFHDEVVMRCKDTEDDKKRIKEVLLRAIDKTNKKLKLNRDLDIDIQFGYNYGDIH